MALVVKGNVSVEPGCHILHFVKDDEILSVSPKDGSLTWISLKTAQILRSVLLQQINHSARLEYWKQYHLYDCLIYENSYILAALKHDSAKSESIIACWDFDGKLLTCNRSSLNHEILYTGPPKRWRFPRLSLPARSNLLFHHDGSVYSLAPLHSSAETLGVNWREGDSLPVLPQRVEYWQISRACHNHHEDHLGRVAMLGDLIAAPILLQDYNYHFEIYLWKFDDLSNCLHQISFTPRLSQSPAFGRALAFF